jgi:hypothetical protein
MRPLASHTSYARPSSPARRASWLVSAPLALLLGACTDNPLPLEAPTDPAAAASVAPATLRTGTGDLITGDAATFAETLKEIGADGEIIVWLKETGTARPSAEFLASLPGSAREAIALTTEAPGVRRRNTLGPSSVRGASADAVLRVLAKAGGLELRKMDALPALTGRLPENARTAAVQLLLRHPNVDYVSAALPTRVKLHAGPLGTNPIDGKHTVHRIPEVWDLTRGSGAKVGILDSGFAREVYSGAFHDDGRFFGSYGILPLGFVDDGCSSSTANQGNCTPYDDQWSSNGNYAHGTALAGVVGQNDNNYGYVGIAPMGITYSMKIAWNTYIHGSCGNGWDDIGNDSAYCIESDDFVRAVDYAAARRFHVLSMSFGGNQSSDVYRALATARNTYGVFLVAATGNTPGAAAIEPASFDVVMGIAGVDAAGNNLYSTAARDVSAFTDVASLAAICYKNYYCDAGSPGRQGGVGGTSAATAVVAGIVGLIRSYHPNETPAQIWERLVNTATGPNKVVDAYAAITYQRPLSVAVSGPSTLAPYDYGTWSAARSGGTGPYTFTWYRDGVLVATGPSYSGYADDYSFELRVDAADANGATAQSWMYVSVQYPQEECGDPNQPRQICQVQ